MHIERGYRIDASKHMWPNDIQDILAELNDLPTDQGFPEGSKPLIFQEVIDLGIAISVECYLMFDVQ